MTSPANHKLLVVTDYYPPHWTGLSKSVGELCNLASTMCAVTVATIRHDRRLPTAERLGAVQVYRAPYLASLSRARISPAFLFLLMRRIGKADSVLVNMPCTLTLPASLLARLMGKRLMLFHQGDLMLPRGPANRIIEKIYDMCTLPACRLADRLATYTPDYARSSRILAPFPSKTASVRIPLPAGTPKQSPEIEKRMRGLKQKYPILVGFAGRFVEEKGFDLLFRAIPSVIRKNPRIHFVFAGETDMKYEHFFEQNKMLLDRVPEAVTILGRLDEGGLAAFYRNLSWFIMPSRSDCYGLVQIEAMREGVPVLVSNIPGARAPVAETGFGALFPPEDPSRMANAILEAVHNRARIMTKKPAALRYITEYPYAETLRDLLGI